jgi:hypothetical protein
MIEDRHLTDQRFAPDGIVLISISVFLRVLCGCSFAIFAVKRFFFR